MAVSASAEVVVVVLSSSVQGSTARDTPDMCCVSVFFLLDFLFAWRETLFCAKEILES